MSNLKADDIMRTFQSTGSYPDDLSGHTIVGMMTIADTHAISMACRKTVFAGRLSIMLAQFNHRFDFTGAEFKEEVDIVQGDGNFDITFNGATFHKGLRIRCNRPSKLTCRGANVIGCIDLSESHFSEMDLERLNFQEQGDENSFLCIKTTVISASFRNSFLVNACFNHSIFIRECTFDHATCWYNIAPGAGNFFSVRFESGATFNNTNFTKGAVFNGSHFFGIAVFVGVNKDNADCMGDFSGVIFEKRVFFDEGRFKELHFYNAEFKEIASFKGIHCMELEINKSIFFQSADFLGAKITSGSRETFRIIKNEFQRNNNIVEATYYQSRELAAYQKELKFKQDPSEYLALWANSISNAHGRSWLRGFGFTILSGALFYILYLCTLHALPFAWGWRGWSSYWSAVSQTCKYFFRFFAIVHDFSFMESYGPTALSYFIDSFCRIVISYGIVQTVQAFRKYGKT